MSPSYLAPTVSVFSSPSQRPGKRMFKWRTAPLTRRSLTCIVRINDVQILRCCNSRQAETPRLRELSVVFCCTVPRRQHGAGSIRLGGHRRTCCTESDSGAAGNLPDAAIISIYGNRARFPPRLLLPFLAPLCVEEKAVGGAGGNGGV